ncbi:unnamed protein product [Trifolium pratense]|uniref:Uncharacterized protein n=1 Tax=Trifolium pratense TaxID=57577 RepID=A0ACB0JRS8_TRIPR|nr:unnamed protein product [Trifolium pratense]
MYMYDLTSHQSVFVLYACCIKYMGFIADKFVTAGVQVVQFDQGYMPMTCLLYSGKKIDRILCCFYAAKFFLDGLFSGSNSSIVFKKEVSLMEWLSLDQIPHANAIMNTLFGSTGSRLLDEVTIVAVTSFCSCRNAKC